MYSLNIHNVTSLRVEPPKRVDHEHFVSRWQRFVFSTQEGERFEVVAFLEQDTPLVPPQVEGETPSAPQAVEVVG